MKTVYQLKGIKVLRDQHCILDIPSLALPAQQCIALLGDNGAGKSTLLNLLAFTANPSHGKIICSGQKVSLPLAPPQRRQIGYVTQHPYLLSGTVSDNIALALKLQGIDRKQHSKRIDYALELVNLRHLAEQPAHTLSGGELKRAAIARSIAYQPSILLLDEPFSHLDQTQRQQLEDIIKQLTQQHNTSIIFSTHDRLQGLALADKTINLVAGKTTTSPLLNLFDGYLEKNIFNTGHLTIHTTSQLLNARHVAIDPQEIIISTEALHSSMRNHYQGRLTAISEDADTIHLTVQCGERFHAIISSESLQELNLSLGNTIWISFKSTAVTVF